MTATIPLGELVTIRGGGTPSRTVPEYWNGSIRWATVKDFKSTELAETQETITPAGIRDSATNIIPAGSVIIPTRMAVGKAAVSTIDMAINQDLKALLPTAEVDTRFLLHFMLSHGDYLESQAQGATVKGIKLDLLRSLPFPRIPRTEQRRIAAILDKADAIRRKSEEALTLADDFLRSVFVEMFGRPGQPNPSLPTDELGRICDLFAGNSLPGGTTFNGQEHGLLLLKVGDMNLPGNEDVVQVAREWIDEGRVSGPAIRAPKDAIVFPKRGGAIATNKKRVLGRDCILDPNLMAVAPKSGSPISFQFLRVWFDLLDLSTISNGSTVPQLNKGDLLPLELPIPRPNDLIAFDRIFGSVTRVRQRLADDLGMSEYLFAALSQRAFSGDL